MSLGAHKPTARSPAHGLRFKKRLVLQTEAPTNTEVNYKQNAVVHKMAVVYLDHSPHRACVSADTGTHPRGLSKHKNILPPLYSWASDHHSAEMG
jgi:hypothetical protein